MMEEFCEKNDKKRCKKICCIEIVTAIIAIALFFAIGLVVGAFFSLVILTSLAAIIVLISLLALLLIVSIILLLCNKK